MSRSKVIATGVVLTWRRRGTYFGLAIALLTTFPGCSQPQLANTRSSAADLAQAILDGVSAKDINRLRLLGLSEDEFREIVWPSLPAARPERNLPFSYVWGDLEQKSQQSLRVIVMEHGGTQYQLEDVRFAGPPRDYGAFRVYSDARFVVRGETGAAELRLCGSFIEKGGVWKAFSFAIDQ